MGARQMGIGYATTCLHDEWAMTNNIAGLSKIKSPVTSFSYLLNPSFKPFNKRSAMIAAPTSIGVFGASFYKFGDNLYNEQVASLGYAHKMGLASLGLRINYVQYNTEGFGMQHAVTIGFGGIAEITPHLLVGSYITNLTSQKLNNEGEYVPTKMYVGIAFKPNESVYISTEIEKDLDLEPIVKTGIEYQFNKKFFGRTGFNLNPDAAFIGCGFNLKKFTLDYAAKYDLRLGLNHQASLSYKFITK